MKARSRKRAGLLVVDQAMVDDAAYGLMLWDVESKGTLNRVINMVRQDKPVVVYLAPRSRSRTSLSQRRDGFAEQLRASECAAVRVGTWIGIEHVQSRAPGAGLVHHPSLSLSRQTKEGLSICLSQNRIWFELAQISPRFLPHLATSA